MANNETVTKSQDNQTHKLDYVVGGSGDERHKASYYNRYRKAKKRVLISLGAVGTTAALGVATIFGIGVYRAVKSGEDFVSSLGDGAHKVIEAVENIPEVLEELLDSEPDYAALAADAQARINDMGSLIVLHESASGLNRALKMDRPYWWGLNSQWVQASGSTDIYETIRILSEQNTLDENGAQQSLPMVTFTYAGEQEGKNVIAVNIPSEAVEFIMGRVDIEGEGNDKAPLRAYFDAYKV